MENISQPNDGTSVDPRDFTVTFQATLFIKGECSINEEEIRAAWGRGEIAFGRNDYDENAQAESGCAYLGDQHVGYYLIDDGVLGVSRRFIDMLGINETEPAT